MGRVSSCATFAIKARRCPLVNIAVVMAVASSTCRTKKAHDPKVQNFY